jgi:hypothetical protein
LRRRLDPIQLNSADNRKENLDLEKVEMILVQLEEAKRLMDVGGVARLRLAFLLLDNVVEISMRRMLSSYLMHNDFNVRMIKKFEEYSDVPEVKERISEIRKEIISPGKIDKIENYFDSKVNFLQGKGVIDGPVASTIKKMHAYRNEAYHRDSVRSETVETATVIYFDAACIVLSGVPVVAISSNQSESFKELLERYGIEQGFEVFQCMKIVGNRLKEELAIDSSAVKDALVGHLQSRLKGMEDSLAYIKDSIFPSLSMGEIIKIIQANKDPRYADLEEVFSESFPYSERNIETWKRQVRELSKKQDVYEMFSRFAQIEDSFEAFEKIVIDAEVQADMEVQWQIDEIRGK